MYLKQGHFQGILGNSNCVQFTPILSSVVICDCIPLCSAALQGEGHGKVFPEDGKISAGRC